MQAVGLMVRESKDAAELRHEMRDLTKEQNGLSVVVGIAACEAMHRETMTGLSHTLSVGLG